MPSRKPILLALGDVHIRHTTPVSRAEKDWYAVMTARFQQLKAKQHELGMVPILVAGDLVDRFNLPSSVVTWALENIPRLYSCVGQHDLDNWQYESRLRGTYGALVKARIVTDLPAEQWTTIPGETPIHVWSLPWGFNSVPETLPDGIKVAAIHRYLWSTDKNKHMGAEENSRVTSLAGLLPMFNCLVTGDNHCQFRAGKVHNSGSLFSTTSAQIKHIPSLCVLYNDGTSEAVPFPEEKAWQDSVTEVARETKRSGLVDELENLDIEGADFAHLLSVLEDKSGERTKKIVRELRGAIFGN